MNPERLQTHSLRTTPGGDALAQVMAAALAAVEPEAAVSRFLRREGEMLYVDEQSYDLQTIKRVFVIGAGKAGAPMATAATAVLGERLTAGLVVVKDGYATSSSAGPTEVIEASHPLPDERGVRAAQRIVDLLADTTAGDLVLVLLSGGGSALLTLPADGISLEDKIALTDSLLRCGATINEINCLRKHLSKVKGGRLAQHAAPASVATLALSDVIGSPLDVIASGPTVPDPTSFGDALGILQRYGILDQVPEPIVAYLERGQAGEIPETPKPGDPLFERVRNVVIGSNEIAALAAVDAAQRLGYRALLLTTYLEGEARVVGGVLAAIAREIALYDRPLPKPALLVTGGETTVTLRGDGLGGRNQELALGAVQGLTGLPNTTLVALATDGGDGPTDAAGAVVTGETLERAQALGLDPNTFLSHNDAYHFFEALDDLLKPGPTLTNVNDLVLIAVGEGDSNGQID